MQHVMCVIGGERESVALAGELVVRMNGVLQTAGLADEREGAVPHRDHLRQSARLKQRRHEQQVAACIDLVCQIAVEHDIRRDLVRRPSLCAQEHLLVSVVAGAEYDQTDVQTEDIAQNTLNQIQTLLADQTSDHADDQRVVVCLETAHLEQTVAVLFLVLERFDRVILEEVRVGLRIKLLDVQTVDDAADLALIPAQDGIQLEAVVRRLDFLCVGRRDGGDTVCTDNCRLHQVDVAVLLEESVVVMVAVDAEYVIRDLASELTLILDVVNRKYRLDAVVPGTIAVMNTVINRNQRSLPVVAVDDVRLVADCRKHIQYGAAEERKTLRVVIFAVNLSALEIVFVVNEVVGDAVLLQTENAAVLIAPRQLHIQAGDKRHLVAPFLRNLRIQRADYTYLAPLLRQSLRQGACNVSETAGLDKRRHFARYI